MSSGNKEKSTVTCHTMLGKGTPIVTYALENIARSNSVCQRQRNQFWEMYFQILTQTSKHVLSDIVNMLLTGNQSKITTGSPSLYTRYHLQRILHYEFKSILRIDYILKGLDLCQKIYIFSRSYQILSWVQAAWATCGVTQYSSSSNIYQCGCNRNMYLFGSIEDFPVLKMTT